MERLKTPTGKVVTEALSFNGSVEDFKSYVLSVCEKHSPQDEVEIYADAEGWVYLEVKDYTIETYSEYKQRVSLKIQELENELTQLKEKL